MRQGVELLSSFGARVREKRLRLGMSQEALAAVSGLDRTYISSIERGKRNVSLLNLVTLAAGLDTAVGVLLEGLEADGMVAHDE